MQVTISTLSHWTSIHRDTVRRRLAPLLTGTRGETVDSTRALPMLYGTDNRLDPTQERARLDKTRRELAELDFAKRQATLVDSAGVERAAFQFGRILQKALVDVFPGRVSMEIAGMTDPWEIEKFIREKMRIELASVSKLKPEEIEDDVRTE
jgi:hypothetical protein